MKLQFTKSNRKYKWSTDYNMHQRFAYNVILTSLKNLYPTAIVEYSIKNKRFRRYKTFITFKDDADEAEFMFMHHSNNGIEV